MSKRVTYLKAAITLPAPYSSDTVSEGNDETIQHYDMHLLDAEESPIGMPVIHVVPIHKSITKDLYIPATLCVFQLAKEIVKEETFDIPLVQLPGAKVKSEVDFRH